MANYVYQLESYNSRKREWQYEKTYSTMKPAKDMCVQESRMGGKKWRILKVQIMYVYDKGKVVNK